jgi:hypothetical protein
MVELTPYFHRNMALNVVFFNSNYILAGLEIVEISGFQLLLRFLLGKKWNTRNF